jgi:hypothetical protein
MCFCISQEAVLELKLQQFLVLILFLRYRISSKKYLCFARIGQGRQHF